MAGITVGGLASGLDVNSIVEQLVAAERAPTEKRLTFKEATYTAQLSTYGTLKGALSKFQTSVRSLSTASKFNARSATVSDDKVLTVSASSIADSGSYSIKVDKLAQNHGLASVGFDSTTDAVGTGTLTFRLGTTAFDVDGNYDSFTQKPDSSTFTLEIDSSNNSLQGIRDAINDRDMGVRASIVNDGSGFRLVLTGEDTGAENSIQVTVADSDYDAGTNAGGNTDASGLSRLAYNQTAANMTQTLEAQDAELTVNGLTVTSASNTVTGVVDGVTLNLKSTSTTAVTLGVDRNKEGARTAVDGFVTAYNELNAILDTMSQYDPDAKQGGLLQGDPLLRSISTQIRRTLLPSDETGLILADLGITTLSKDTVQSDGTMLSAGSLVVDSAMLDKAMEERFDDIAKVFVAAGTTTDAGVTYLSGAGAAASGRYGINITRAASQGSLTGAALADPASIVIDGNNNNFTISIDGTSSGSISLTEGSYTAETLAAEIQSRINGSGNLKDRGLGVEVTVEAGRFVINSNTYGSASTVAITAVDSASAATMGLSVATGSTGEDVAGTIGGVAATGSGQMLTGSGAAAGIILEISGDTTGSRGFVEFSRGMAGRMVSVLDAFLKSDGLIDEKTSSLNDRVAELTEQRAKLDERIAGFEERYRAQFTALELMISQLNTTGQFLTQQLDGLLSMNRKK